MPVMWWSSTVRISCRTAEGLPRHSLSATPEAAVEVLPSRRARTALRQRNLPAASLEELRDEPVTAVYSAAGRHHAADDRHPARRLGGLSATARFRSAAGRLPHDSGANVLSRRQPGSHGFLGHRPARAPVRAHSWPESDDFDEFLRLLRHHTAIRIGP